jgi:hypothetical protein
MLIEGLAGKGPEPTSLGMPRRTCRFWTARGGRQGRWPPLPQSHRREGRGDGAGAFGLGSHRPGGLGACNALRDSAQEATRWWRAPGPLTRVVTAGRMDGQAEAQARVVAGRRPRGLTRLTGPRRPSEHTARRRARRRLWNRPLEPPPAKAFGKALRKNFLESTQQRDMRAGRDRGTVPYTAGQRSDKRRPCTHQCEG